MDNEITIHRWDSDELNDFHVCIGGIELNIPKDTRHGPYMHNFYDIQYCRSGGFTLWLNEKPFSVCANTLYCVPPYVKVEKHFTEENTDCIYVSVSGLWAKQHLNAVGFSEETPLFPKSVPKGTVNRLYTLLKTLDCFPITDGNNPKTNQLVANDTYQERTYERQLQRLGEFSLFLSELMHLKGPSDKGVDKKQFYVNLAIAYIKANYSQNLGVNDVANYIGLNRSYLYSLFRQRTGLSIQEYIISTRIHAACDLLRGSDAPIKAIAASVGYDSSTFSHVFKSFIGISPLEYRATIK